MLTRLVCVEVGNRVCMWSLKRRYCWDTYRDTSPPPTRLFLCLVTLTSFRDKNPPPLILFLTSHVCFSVFCCLFICFDSHLFFTAFTRQRSRPAQSPFDIRSMSRRKMERRRREKRAWTGQVVGRVAEPGLQPHTYGPHGRAIFSMSMSTGGVGLLLVFLEISRVTASLWETRGDRRKNEDSMCSRSGR